MSPAVQLVRKLVSVLESSEKLSLYIYDPAGIGSGLQILSRKLRLRLERAAGESSLIDRTGRTLKVELRFGFDVAIARIIWNYTVMVFFLFHRWNHSPQWISWKSTF